MREQPSRFVIQQTLHHGLHGDAGANLRVPWIDGCGEHVGQCILNGQFAAGVRHADDAEVGGSCVWVAMAHPRDIGHLWARQVGGADFANAVNVALR